MDSLSHEEENLIIDIINLFKLEKKRKQLKIRYLKISRIFVSMKKKKIIINQ